MFSKEGCLACTFAFEGTSGVLTNAGLFSANVIVADR